MPAAAADPCAPSSLRGGLVRVAAVGRARAECRLRRELLGAPSSPRSFERRRVGCKVVPKSTVLATRHEPPCPCTVTGCSSLVPRCDHPATVPRPPKECRTESRRHSSRPVVPPSRAARRRLTVRIGLDAAVKEMLRPASGTAQQYQVAAKLRTPGPGKARANRSTSFRRLSRPLLPPPIRKKCSAAVKARNQGEPCQPPKAVFTSLRRPLIAGEARERAAKKKKRL